MNNPFLYLLGNQHLGQNFQNVGIAIEKKKTYVKRGKDYFTGGMLLPDRVYSADSTGTGDYRYGFNTQERDDEIYGAGNSYSAEYWQYDARLMRRWNLDPKPNPSFSNYACFANNPILFSDHDGDTTWVYSKKGEFLELINDTKENEIHYTGKLSYQLSSNKHKGDDNKRAEYVRSKSHAYIGKSTLDDLASVVNGGTQKERGGFLYLEKGSRELKVWECTECSQYWKKIRLPKSAPSELKDMEIFSWWHSHLSIFPVDHKKFKKGTQIPDFDKPSGTSHDDYDNEDGDYNTYAGNKDSGLSNLPAGPAIIIHRKGVTTFRSNGTDVETGESIGPNDLDNGFKVIRWDWGD